MFAAWIATEVWAMPIDFHWRCTYAVLTVLLFLLRCAGWGIEVNSLFSAGSDPDKKDT